MLTLADPLDALLRLQRDLDARLESDWLEDATTGTGTFPPINIFQQGHDFIVIVELPGVSKDGLTLEAKGDAIRIAGTKTVAYGSDISVHRRERISGSFDRTIQVPIQIDPDAVTAEFQEGMLAVFIRRGPWGVVHATWPEAAEADLQVETLEELPAVLQGL